jgi:hypothetical protein
MHVNNDWDGIRFRTGSSICQEHGACFILMGTVNWENEIES